MKSLRNRKIRRGRGPLRRLLDEELATQVREAIFSLPPLQREALILFEYEGLSLNEVAEIAGTDVGAIKARLIQGSGRFETDPAALSEKQSGIE